MFPFRLYRVKLVCPPEPLTVVKVVPSVEVCHSFTVLLVWLRFAVKVMEVFFSRPVRVMTGSPV